MSVTNDVSIWLVAVQVSAGVFYVLKTIYLLTLNKRVIIYHKVDKCDR
jgi:hypothetical protein